MTACSDFIRLLLEELKFFEADKFTLFEKLLGFINKPDSWWFAEFDNDQAEEEYRAYEDQIKSILKGIYVYKSRGVVGRY